MSIDSIDVMSSKMAAVFHLNCGMEVVRNTTTCSSQGGVALSKHAKKTLGLKPLPHQMVPISSLS